MKKAKNLILLVGLIIVAIIVFKNDYKVTATGSTDSTIVIRKNSYSESNNQLLVDLVINKPIKEYTFVLNYDIDEMKVLTYWSQQDASGDMDDFFVNNSLDVPIDRIDYEEGRLEFFSVEAEDDRSASVNDLICSIRFQFTSEDTVLEEDIADVNDLFEIESVAVMDEDGSYIENVETLDLNEMKKSVDSVEFTDVVFSKDKYVHGETVEVTGGKIKINYSNPTSSRTIDLSNASDSPIQVGDITATADFFNPYIQLAYKGKTSNQVSVNIIDKINLVQIENSVKTEYAYGESFDPQDAKVYLDFVTGRRVVKTISELIDDGIVTIGNFNSTADAIKTTNVTQTVTITVNIPEYDFFASTDFVQVTISSQNLISVNVDDQSTVTEDLSNVRITDLITQINWVTEPYQEYKYGDALKDVLEKIKITYLSGAEKNNVSVTKSMISEDDATNSTFDSTVLGERNLKVTYTYSEQGETKSKVLKYPILVKDYITGIEMTDDIRKEYSYGESNLDVGNTSIKVKMASGAETTKTLSEMILDGSVTIEGFNTTAYPKQSKAETVSLKINISEYDYEETKTVNIVVIDHVEKIELTTFAKANIKTEYLYGENLDVTNGEITITYTSTQTDTEDITPSMVTEENGNQFDNTILGERDLLVTYSYQEGVQTTQGLTATTPLSKTTTYKINVSDYITSTQLDDQIKKVYTYGDSSLDVGDTSLTIKMASGAETTKTLSEMITDGSATIEGFDSTSYPKQTKNETVNLKINITDYNYEETKTINIVVIDYVEKIELTDAAKTNIKTEYIYGENLDVTNGQIKVTYTSTQTDIKDITTNMVTETNNNQFDNTELGTRDLLVTYTYQEGNNNGQIVSKTKTTTYEIEIKDYVESIELNDQIKKVYSYGDSDLDIGDSSLTIKMASGLENTKTLNEMITEGTVTIEGFDSTSYPKQTKTEILNIKINLPDEDYEETKHVNIKVIDHVEEIELTDDAKTNLKKKYRHSQALDVTNGQIIIKYESNQTEIIDMTEDMVTEEDGSPFSNSAIGTRTVLVVYTYQEGNENGDMVTKTKQTSYEVEVGDYIRRIEMQENIRKIYAYGEDALDVKNTQMKVIMAGGESIQIPLSQMIAEGKAVVEGFDTMSYPKQTQNETVVLKIYMSEYDYEETRNIYITVIDYVEEVDLTPESKEKIKKNYRIGEELDLTDGQIEVVYTSRQYDILDIEENMVKEENGNQFDNMKKGTRNLFVNYTYQEGNDEAEIVQKTKQATYEINVEDYIRDIEIEDNIKKIYSYGEEALDVSNTRVIIKMASGEDITKSLREMIDTGQATVAGFDSTSYPKQTKKETVNITLNIEENNYQKTIPVNITVIDYVKEIKLTDEAIQKMKRKYRYEDELDTTYGQIEVIFTSRQTEIVDITNNMVTEVDGNQFDNLKVGARNLVVTYTYQEGNANSELIDKTKTVLYGIEIENYLEYIKLTKDILELDYGTEITDEILLDTYKVIPVMADGEELEPIQLTKDMIQGTYNILENGIYDVQVEYNGKHTRFQIKVNEDKIVEVLFDEGTMKKEYKFDESLNLDGSKVIIKKQNGTEYEVNFSEDTVQDFKLSYVGHQEFNMIYDGFKLDNAIKLDIEDYIIGIELIKPFKTTYLQQETELDLTGAYIQPIMASGAYGDLIPITTDMIENFDSERLGAQILTVRYEGFEQQFEIIKNVQTGSR